MIKRLERIIYTTTLLVILLIGYSVVNGASCRYELEVQRFDSKTQMQRDSFVTCYRGKVMVLHSQMAPDGSTTSKWKVTARQLKFGKQVIFFVYDRERLSQLTSNTANDHYNEMFSGYSTLFYHIERVGDRLFIFENFPDNNVLEGKVDGFLDFWDMLTR